MRLFIAFPLPATVRVKLHETSTALREQGGRGNITASENLHLTAVFLGETAPSKADRIMDILKSVAHNFAPFAIDIHGIGRFQREGGDVLWAGVNENKVLSGLVKDLCSELRRAGFAPEDRPYRPHITLLRRAVFSVPFEELKKKHELCISGIPVERIALMNSERIGGELRYSPLFEAPFPKGGAQ